MGTTNNPKAVIYARVSSREQEKEGFSIPAQISLLKEYAAKNKIHVVRVFKEAETAKKAGRKEFENMLKFISENDDINDILVEKTDRLYRNITDWTKIDYETLGIKIHLAKEGDILSKDSSSNQKFMHGIKVLMAKNYVDNLSEEVKKGQAEKLKLGIWPGKAPIGYLNKLDDKTIVIDPKIAPMIRRAYEMAASGNYSLSKIKKELFHLGVRGSRSGKELAKSQMARILSNPFYHGDIQFDRKIYKGSHEPIIDKPLFEKVQVILGNKSPKVSMSKHDFTYRGNLKCGHCGCQVTAEIKKKKYIYYHCTNGKGDCSNVIYLREEKIEQSYIEALSRISVPETIIEYTREALLGSQKEEQEFRESQITLLTARYKKLENYIDKLYTDKLEEKIDLGYWESRTATYKNEQTEILGKIEALKSSNTKYMVEGIKLMEIANKAAKLFPMMTKEEKREMVSLVISNPRLENASIQYDYKKPFGQLVNVGDLRKWRERRDSNSRPPA